MIDLFDTKNKTGRIRVVSAVRTNDMDEISLQDGDVLDVLPLRNRVLFPGVMMPVVVGRQKSLKLVTNAYNKELPVAVCCQKERDTQDPKDTDLYDIGTAARVRQIIELQKDEPKMVILEGIERIRVDEFTSARSGLKA